MRRRDVIDLTAGIFRKALRFPLTDGEQRWLRDHAALSREALHSIERRQRRESAKGARR